MSKVNAALQIVPAGNNKEAVYAMVDEAIKAIAASGLTYRVCPFETVIEGEYQQVMQAVEAAQDAVFDAGAEDMLVYIKIQRSKNKEVKIEDKMKKYT